jgi:hypothetical protein
MTSDSIDDSRDDEASTDGTDPFEVTDIVSPGLARGAPPVLVVGAM